MNLKEFEIVIVPPPNAAREEKKRVVPVETWSRVCGFFRPVSGFNLGKQEEFRERKTYKINTGEGR